LVYQECKHCSAKWKDIGLNLGISKNSLDIIKTNNPLNCEHCMSEMLAKWLRKENAKSNPSWRSLCQALYSVAPLSVQEVNRNFQIFVMFFAKES